MATITIRDLEEDVVRRLKNLADGNSRSLESEVRYILEAAIANDREAMAAKRRAFLEHSRTLRKLTANRPQTPSELLIRVDRDSDHGRA